MEFAEVEIGEISRRADSRTTATSDAGLQFGHFPQNLVAFAQVIAIDVDCAGFRYGVSEVDRCHMVYTLRYSATAVAAA